MTGSKQSADTFLDGLTDGTFNYYTAEHDTIEVQINGDRAAMLGRSRVLAAVYGGRKHPLAAAGRVYFTENRLRLEDHQLQSVNVLSISVL